MRWQVRSHFVHEEEQLQFPFGRLLGEHPVVEFAGQFLHEILLLVLVLNRVQVDDVQRNLAGHRRFGERVDVDRHAVGKEQLIDAA